MDIKWYIYRPSAYYGSFTNKANCRYKIRVEQGGFYQCLYKPKETIGGYGFCKRHAKIVNERIK